MAEYCAGLASLSDGGICRRSNVAVCLTLYNEDSDYLVGTLCGLISNFSELNHLRDDPESIPSTICVVLDGLERASENTISLIKRLGFEDLACDFDGRCERSKILPVDSHRIDILYDLFQSRVMGGALPWLSESISVLKEIIESKPRYRKDLNLDLLFYVKSFNQGKLDSHWHFFKKICPVLNPAYCVQIDVGTMPQPSALKIGIEHLECRDDVAAIASRTYIPPPRGGFDSIGIWQYMDCLTERFILWPAEIASGYLSVIPGQLSILRCEALEYLHVNFAAGCQANPVYFNGLEEGGSFFKKTMHLAEDRVLGCEIIQTEGTDWKIDYCPDSVALTDPCESWAELLQQRRRWICSTFACKVWVVSQIFKQSCSKSERGSPKSVSAWIPACAYLMLNIIFQWFLMAAILSGYISLLFSGYELLLRQSSTWASAYAIFGAILVATLFGQVIVYGMWPNSYLVNFITRVSIFIQVAMLAVSGSVLILLSNGLSSVFIFILVSGLCAVCFLCAVRYFSVDSSKNALRYMVQYSVLCLPVHLCLNLYAIVKVADLTWGTKGKTQVSDGEGRYIAHILLAGRAVQFAYFLTSGAFVLMLVLIFKVDGFQPIILLFLMASVNIMLSWKYMLSLILPRSPKTVSGIG